MTRRPSLPTITLAGLAILAALLTGCVAPQPRGADRERPAGDGQALVGDVSLDPSDVLERSMSEGCGLIPFDALRSTCIEQNNGLHDPEACGAHACQKSAGPAVNAQRLQAWRSCAERRRLINDAFASTLTRIAKFKSESPAYKGWSKKYKDALALLAEKVEQGQPGHETAERNAKAAVVDCERLVGGDRRRDARTPEFAHPRPPHRPA